MTHTDSLNNAIRALVFRARTNPDDSSEDAARRVADVLLRDRVKGVPHCPMECPASRWFRAALGFPRLRLLVTESSLLLLLPREAGEVRMVRVELPACVRGAIALVGARRVPGLIEEAA